MRKFSQLYESIMEKRLNAIEAMFQKMEDASDEKIIEKLAELEHEQWMKWAKDIASKENLSDKRVKHWEEECFMPYDELSEEMKEFDREWARKALKILKEANNGRI